jgi:CPA2 family monovalent cation:H+ antiporter-2
LHFSLKDLMSVARVAVPGALIQMAGATALGFGMGLALGWSPGASLVFGLALSVASTVVLVRALQDRRLTESRDGRIAIGWLILQDLVMVLTLVLLPPLADALGTATAETDVEVLDQTIQVGLAGALAITLAKVALFFALMLVVGRRVVPLLLHYVAHTGSRELFRLAVLSVALGIAFGAAELFDVSLALGAFFPT